MPQLQSPPGKTVDLYRGWWIVLLIALSAAVGQAFGRFSYGVILPAIRDNLGITNTLAGLIGGANVGAYLLGTLFVAWASNRSSLLNLMRCGLALATLGLLIASFSRSPLPLAIALSVAGFGGACLWIPAPVLAADAVPPAKRGIAVGLVSTGIGLGVAFVSLASGTLRSSYGDDAWADVYAIQFAVGFVLFVLVLIYVRHQQVAATTQQSSGLSALTKMPGWLPILAVYATFGSMYLLVMGFLTTRLEDDSLWSSADAAFAFTTMGFAMILGGPAFILVAQQIGVRATLAGAFGLWPIFVGVVMTGYSAPTMFACIGLGFLFSAIPTLVTLYVVENTTTKNYGPSFAAATLAFGIAQTIAPPIGGYIADYTGAFTLVFLLAGALGLVGLLAALRLPRAAPR